MNKDVTINSEKYEIYVNTINTRKKSMDDIDIVFNTNNTWLRSNNPGSISSVKSFFANIFQYLPLSPLSETIYYNVGYLDQKQKYQLLKENDWVYIDPKSIYKTLSNIDRDFSYTAAHELGHSILKAYAEKGGGSTDHSYKHKYSSTYSNPISIKKGGEDYQLLVGDIDLMKYYVNEPLWKDFDRIVASEEDVLGLLWLSKLKIK